MGEITFPTTKMTVFELGLSSPNSIVHQSIYTKAEQVHYRGNMRWIGRIGWPRLNISDNEAAIEEIELFVLSAYGTVNTFKVPIPRNQLTRFAGTGALGFTSSTNTPQSSTITVTAQGTLQVGDYLNHEEGLHRITAKDGYDLTIVPSIALNAGSVIWRQPTLLARFLDTELRLPREGSWAGPWNFDIMEAS